jgi:hypothetical protein
MTGARLEAHVLELAKELKVRVKLPEREPINPEPGGQITCFRVTGAYAKVYLTHRPRTPEAYLVALHELGHKHVWNNNPGILRMSQKDRGWLYEEERLAWKWAREQSLIPIDKELDEKICARLQSYAILQG